MRQSLSDFDVSLARIRLLADHLNQSLGAALADSNLRALHETQQCGAIVLLTGYFEAFLKDLVRHYVDGLSRSGLAFDDLPDAVRHRHYEGGGRALTHASEAGRKGRATPFGNVAREDIVERLYSTASGATSYQIVWEAFADTRANPGPEVVKEIAQNLGAKDVWPEISRKAETRAVGLRRH
ncbi:MAG: hypothetical protein HC897_11850 [Thermoanaerobaculia bacterium]|nr:hypothetical protein [Thermoanaerobaculia bacterium]